MFATSGGKVEISVAGVLFLVAATVVAAAVVFFLGIYVGKGMVEERLAQEQRVVKVPVPANGEAPKNGEVDVTFWDKLAKGESSPVPTTFVPPAPTRTPAEMPIFVPPPRTPTAAPPPTAPPPTEPPPLAELSGFQVQVNAIGERPRAEKLVRELKDAGYKARISPAKVNGRVLYRVRVGQFATEEEARQAVARLREQGYPQAFLAAQ